MTIWQTWLTSECTTLLYFNVYSVPSFAFAVRRHAAARHRTIFRVLPNSYSRTGAPPLLDSITSGRCPDSATPVDERPNFRYGVLQLGWEK